MSKVTEIATEIATEIKRIQDAKADIKTAIENKGVTVGDGTIATYAEKIGEISSGGGINLLDYAITAPTFQGADFTDIPNVVANIPNFNGKNINAMFNLTTNLETVKLICNIRDVAMETTTAFYSSRTLRVIDLSEFNTLFSTVTSTFGSCVSLEEIIGTISFAGTSPFTNTFGQCDKLREIRIAENCISKNISFSACSLLSIDSVNSIIGGLVDLTGGTQQTLTFHKTVGGNLTDEQKAIITAKNWGLVY